MLSCVSLDISKNGIRPSRAHLTLNCVEQLSWYRALCLIKLFFCCLNCNLTILVSQFHTVNGQIKIAYSPCIPLWSLKFTVNWHVKSIFLMQWLTITFCTSMFLTFILWKSFYYMAFNPQQSKWNPISFYAISVCTNIWGLYAELV